jgi:hypothetical protein
LLCTRLSARTLLAHQATLLCCPENKDVTIFAIAMNKFAIPLDFLFSLLLHCVVSRYTETRTMTTKRPRSASLHRGTLDEQHPVVAFHGEAWVGDYLHVLRETFRAEYEAVFEDICTTYRVA